MHIKKKLIENIRSFYGENWEYVSFKLTIDGIRYFCPYGKKQIRIENKDLRKRIIKVFGAWQKYRILKISSAFDPESKIFYFERRNKNSKLIDWS
jgi:hypothetical protein